MPQQVRGVVAHKKGDPVSVETIVVPDPGPGEAVVKVQACGVCHTDLHYREGGINDDFPFLLGHEAAGIVEAVGEGVTDVAPGDFVILNWRAVCGNCRACRRGEPWYCFTTHNAAQKMTLTSGQELSPALGIGAFVEKTLVHAGQCTKVNPAAKPEVAGLLGCGVMAGIGAAINTGKVGPRRLHRRHRLRRGRQRRHRRRPARRARPRSSRSTSTTGSSSWAKDFGATHTINSREQRRGRGRPGAHRRQRRERRRRRRRPPRDLQPGLLRPRPRRHRRARRRAHPGHDASSCPLLDVFGRGGATKSSWYGDCLPTRDFPMLIDLHLQGRLPLEKFVSETIGLDDVEAAFDKMHKGEVLRSVVVF